MTSPPPGSSAASDLGIARAAVTGYAEEFNTRYLGAHGVASALGLWLLLAVVASTSRGEDRRQLQQVLGLSVDDAAVLAQQLLADPHPAVSSAVALWADAGRLLPDFGAWAERLPSSVETGPVPTQAEADAWARRRTGGMIERFPVTLDPASLLVLASALATDVTWPEPMKTASAKLMGGLFANRVTSCLVAPERSDQQLFDTDAAGRVAACEMSSESGLRVLSVIAEESLPPAQVHVAALQVAASRAGSKDGTDPAVPVDLFDVDLGEGHAWTLTESTASRRTSQERLAEFVTYLPAWSASTTHDLTSAPGVSPASKTLGEFAHALDRPVAFEARQSAVAEFTRVGFKAAAVTVIAMRATGVPSDPRRVRLRRAEVKFGRPYAVVATAAGHGAWDGLPVFSAWVERPAEASERASGR
ncbi:hypothetical protein BH18ACT9_BH18ACT9_18370 [soil metagenome]